MSVQYTAIFHGCKNDNFQMKIFDVFLICAQNIDCGYTLEPPHRGGSNEYPQSMFWSKNKKKYVYPSKPHFFYIKVGCKGVFITRTCYPDAMNVYIFYFNFEEKTLIICFLLLEFLCRLMVLCECEVANLIWKANFNLINRTDV